MRLQMNVFGLDDLRRNFKAIEHALTDPRRGIAEEIEYALNQTIVPEAQRNVWDLFNTEGNFPAHIKTRRVNQYRVDILVDAVYAAVHEYGGTFTITAKQRRYFWAMWYATQDEMWKALALSVQYTIPARPYLRPAIDAKRDDAIKLTARLLWEEMNRVVYLSPETFGPQQVMRRELSAVLAKPEVRGLVRRLTR